MSRAEWLQAICHPSWPDVKPNIGEHGDPNSPLIRMLTESEEYRRNYIAYLIAHHRLPTRQLLNDLLPDVADEIEDAVFEVIEYAKA
jgi:hypothetical protein